MSFLLCLVSCFAIRPELKESKNPIEFFGIAGDLPDHSEKDNCHGIIVEGREFLFKGDYKRFPENILGKNVKVSGMLKKRKLPMFVWDQEKYPNGPVPQGIPVPPGTDIEKDSVYYIIENPEWEMNE